MGVVSKSQRSCFGRVVLSALSNFQFKFLPFLAFFLLREHFYMCSTAPHTHSHVCHLLIYSSSFFSFCYYGVCLPLPLCLKGGETALMLASYNGETATMELLLGAGADKDAKSKVRERMREIEARTHTHTCG